MGANVRHAALTAALAISAGVLAACGGTAPPADLVSVSNGGCGSGWHLAGPGWHTFQIYNAAAEGGEVDLVNPADGAIYAEVEALGPGTTSPMRLPGGVSSPRWTGFYRLEFGLWHGQSARQLTSVASTLDTDARALRAAWPATEINLLQVGLRTHEILENALEFQLTGHDDYGSGSTLATTGANFTGTLELLTVLHPLLITRYAGLPAVYT